MEQLDPGTNPSLSTSGASVTALDITPALLEAGAKRATAAGLDVTWVHGDAQAMPLPDASFDRVLSCVGVQFCTDHRAAATELVRVCRPGGRITLIAWTPEGFIGQILAATGKATGAGGSGPSPLDWGHETGIHDLFGARVANIALHCGHVDMPAASAAAWVNYMATAYGPMVRARIALEQRGTWTTLRDQLIEIAVAHDAGDGGRFAGRAEYLSAILQR
jgi:SAM-dependent methyltransferase